MQLCESKVDEPELAREVAVAGQPRRPVRFEVAGRQPAGIAQHGEQGDVVVNAARTDPGLAAPQVVIGYLRLHPRAGGVIRVLLGVGLMSGARLQRERARRDGIAQIWLFGSRARGTAAADSDWDLLVIVPDELAPIGFDDPMTVWKVKQGTSVRADVLVCRASEFDEDRTTHNTIAYDAAVEGVRVA